MKDKNEVDSEKREILAACNEDMLFCDGYDCALIGTADRFGMNSVAAYAYEKVIEKLMADGMAREDAVEYFEYNILGAGMGENTPVFITLLQPPPGGGK